MNNPQSNQSHMISLVRSQLSEAIAYWYYVGGQCILVRIKRRSQKIAILTLVEGFYDEAVFDGGQQIISSTFPNFTLKYNQILLLNQ